MTAILNAIGADSTATQYIYDSEGRLAQTVYPDSTFLAVTYDPVDGKQRAITFDRGTTSFVYDATSGNLKQIIGAAPTGQAGDTLLYNYDGSLALSEEWCGEVSGRIEVKYDNSQRVIKETVNGSDSVNIAYDKDDNLTKVGAYAVKRNTLNGLVTSDTVGTIITDYTYNTIGELTGVNAKRSGTAFYTVAYTRDSLGRISVKQETIEGTAQRFNYFYDSAGRLKGVKRNDTSQAIYSYDANGNRIARTTPAAVDSGKYDAQDRLLSYSTTKYFYTPAGYLSAKIDTITGDTTRYSYDVMGNLINVRLANGNVIEYLIDANNRRVEKKLNGNLISRYIYNGDLKPVAELDSIGNITARYVYAEKENVPEYIVKSGVTYRIVTDHLGSPKFVINSTTGAVISRFDYDEFGNITSSYDSLGIIFGFAGGLYDQHTKLVRFGVRDYDASVGRWISKDPAGFAGMDGNHYGYVQQEPINVTDPTGLFAYSSTLSNQQANQIAQKQAAEGQSRFSRAMQSLRNLIGKPFRTKPNFGGYQQPYNQLGQFLTYSANPGLLASPITFFTIGFVQGTAAGYTGSTAPTPINLAQYWGIQLGLLFSTTMSCLGW